MGSRQKQRQQQECLEEKRRALTQALTAKAITTVPLTTEVIPTPTKTALETIPANTMIPEKGIRFTRPKLVVIVFTRTKTLAHQPTPASQKNEDSRHTMDHAKQRKRKIFYLNLKCSSVQHCF